VFTRKIYPFQQRAGVLFGCLPGAPNCCSVVAVAIWPRVVASVCNGLLSARFIND